MAKRTHYGRPASPSFGQCMRQWRTDARLTQEDAAKRLGFECRRPQAYLSLVETGKRPVPEAILLKVANVYGVPAEEVLRQAYEFQLSLPLLEAIGDAEVKAQEEARSRNVEVAELTESDRIVLARFAGYLAVRRTQVGGAPRGESLD